MNISNCRPNQCLSGRGEGRFHRFIWFFLTAVKKLQKHFYESPHSLSVSNLIHQDLIFHTLLHPNINIQPVSYTHLDVYKRQVFRQSMPDFSKALNNPRLDMMVATTVLPSNLPFSFMRTTRHFLQALTSFCAGKVVFFRVRPRIMIGLETVLRVFEIS